MNRIRRKGKEIRKFILNHLEKHPSGNDKLISRSQAKRLLARVERFKIVIFDFKDVDFIGQAFADEIFRVFASEHPEIEFSFIHANREIKQMVERAKSAL